MNINEKVFVVIAHRWGDREMHSYLVGVYSQEHLAVQAAKDEREYRGNKYECRITKTAIDDPTFREIIMELPKEKGD